VSAAEGKPEWQRGYDLDYLRGFAKLFASRHKPLVFGAFGLVKERDVADALAANALVWSRDRASGIACAAIGKALRAPGHFTDFAGREFIVPIGDVRLSAFACADAAEGRKVLDALIARAAQSTLWLEVFEEDATAREAIALVPGLSYVATKIAAGSEVKGIYASHPVAAAPLHKAEAASLVVIRRDFLPHHARTKILAEVAAYADAIKAEPWAQHYSGYNKRHSWTAFALRGYDPTDPGFIIKPAEMSQAWKAENPGRLGAKPLWTQAREAFPSAMRAIADAIGSRECDRIRLMRLAPGGELSRHADITDRDAGLADGRIARLHIPIKTTALVAMHGWDKRGQHVETRFPEGALCYLDQRGPHRVENRDKTADRVHLVIDVRSDAGIRDMIAGGM
jgi:Aspartyl/Asparaginyl beta-hydroxylase